MNKLHFVNSPTPLQFLANISNILNVEVWIKRDDLTGDIMLGGNKLRKFEYLFADALAENADTVVFTGGAQSNMIRAGIPLANRSGFNSVAAYLCERGESAPVANMLLNSFSRHIDEYLGRLSLHELPDALEILRNKLISEGKHPYMVPLGASTPLTVRGYIDAVAETDKQKCINYYDAHYLAVGSAGTYAGLRVGLEQHSCAGRLRGVSVLANSRDAAAMANNLAGSYIAGNCVDDEITDAYIGGGYGIPTAAGLTAIKLLLNSEGILLDHVYTAKAFAALIQDAETGVIPKGGRVLFWHTGGTTGLFALTRF